MRLTTVCSLLLLVLTLSSAPATAAEPEALVAVTDVSTANEPSSTCLSATELQDLEQLHQQDAQALQDHIGGADKEFWKAVALGAGIVIAIIIIF